MRRRHSMRLIGACALSAALPFAAAAPAVTPRYEDQSTAFPDFNGVLLVGVGDRILYTKAIGVADAEAGVPMSAATRFETGSVSKWIAAMTVMKLVDLGKLSLDAPITAWLPEYLADTGRLLTLRHLMSHASGVPNKILAARL